MNDFYIDKELEEININPKEISFGKYIMPDTLGHAEYEDIGARLIEVATKQGQWVGVPYSIIAKQIIDEIENMYMENERKREEFEKSKEHKKGFLTRIYERITNKNQPEETIQEVTEEIEEPEIYSVLSFKILTGGGPDVLFDTIGKMANEGYIKLVEEEDQTFLVPTKKFVETVYKAQHPNLG